MNKRLAVFVILLASTLLSGCASTQPDNRIPKDDTRRVRVSGDLTVEAVSRSGL